MTSPDPTESLDESWNDDAAGHPPQPVLPRGPLMSRSFLSLMAVQFLTVLNDNTFRWLVVPLAKQTLGPTGEPVLGPAAALSLGLAGFTLPFILFATPAGYLADRFSKARVIRACKIAEIFIMLLGMAAILSGQMALLFVVVVMTGAMAALFSPSKSGSIPEQVDDSQLSQANGLMGLMTVVPAAFGFLLGNLLATYAQPKPTDVVSLGTLMPAAVTIMAIAVVGWLVSLGVRFVPAADVTRTIPWNPFAETVTSMKLLASDRPLLRAALGIAFFWTLASLAQMNVDQLGQQELQMPQSRIGVLGMMLVLGVGGGSVLAGRWSGGHVELGIVPLGAIGVALWSMLLCLAGWWGHSAPDSAFYATCVSLLFLGGSAGLFDVPLEAYLQHRSEPRQLGQVLSATNFLAFSGILMISGVYYWMIDILKLSPSLVFLLAGLATIPVALYIILLLPGATIRFFVWLASHTIYKVRILGLENIPKTGPALLTPNHVTFIDGILLMIHLPRPVRFIIYADYVNNPKLGWLARMYDVIPIKADGGPKSLIASLRTAREALNQGNLVCIFPEGQLTRTGQIQPFAPGMLKILQGTGAPVIPVCLHGLWGSIFSFRGGKFFWKWPRQWPYPVSILFGKPIVEPKDVHQVRFVVQELGANAMDAAKRGELTPARQFIRACKKTSKRSRMVDSTGIELTGGMLLASALASRRVLLRDVLDRDEKHVGILLPPSVGCALANLAVTLSRRVTVNLNYTMSEKDINHCIRDAGLKHVITSKRFLEKKPFNLEVPFVFLEDMKQQVRSVDRLLAGLGAYVLPAPIVDRLIGLQRVRLDDPITAIYTSGSTGEPKGVLLSHHNISATIDAANQVFQIEDDDAVLGVVPIFHSLGYLAALWLPVCLTPKIVYHANPLDAKEIGRLAQEHGISILFGTPTFLRGYLKRCEKEQFHKLDLAVVGAEKLPLELAEQFRNKFGILPSEGYGATETSGPAAVNIPDHRSDMVLQKGTKLGTVGRPLPGVVIRAVDPATREPLAVNEEGLLLIKGPNVMLGYWNHPEKTATVIKDGWYDTGDMGMVDDEGFVHITGRISRFSKIGGEMVPHLKIEECLSRICEDPANTDAGIPLAVTSIPDAKKGERLIVLHKRLSKPVPQIIDELSKEGLPNLWIPSTDSFLEVEEIPVLGTGKLDLRAIKQLALDRTKPA
jgi:acyl-[acyl-carrier-protein]-phospholipid O-acyltransferase/long-chain-fatty-acid--[acyl-carrier-protein] ligase